VSTCPCKLQFYPQHLTIYDTIPQVKEKRKKREREKKKKKLNEPAGPG